MSESLVYRPSRPLSLRETLAPLGHGPADPTTIWDDHGLWRTFRTPDGPVTLRLEDDAHGTRLTTAVHATAWGPGAPWAIAAVPSLLGEHDTGDLPAGPGGGPEDDDPAPGPKLGAGSPRGGGPRRGEESPAVDGLPGEAGRHRVREAARAHPGLRLLCTGLPFEALIPAILEQRVTSTEAFRSWARLVLGHGDPAPGPGVPRRLRVVPSPATWRQIPSWRWHRAGVDPRRSRVVLEVCRRATAIERLAALGGAAAREALTSLPGVGVWTAAETVQRSHGDSDAVSVGDYHLAGFIGTALAGRPVDDDGMMRLLSPWTGRRQRVVRLLLAAGIPMRRRGPRATIQDHRWH